MSNTRVELRDFVGNSPNCLDVKEWREKVSVLLTTIKSTRGLSKQLGVYDAFFLTTEGYWAAKNVKEGRGGLGVTVRVANALELLVAAEMNVAKKVNRKKLIASAVVMTAVVLGVLGLPSVAMGQNGADGCLTGVIEKKGWFLDFMVNALVVTVICTVAAMWVYDYNNRIQKGNN
jgi:hypothetical protein